MKITTYSLITLVFSILLSACAATPKQTPLEINQPVPELSALGIDGQAATLQQLSGESGLILVLYRSAEWCPFCIKQLKEMDQWVGLFDDLGYKVAAISYDDIEILKEFTETENLSYPLISDQGTKTFRSYKVLNQQHQPGVRTYGIPHPGVLVINKNQELTHKYFYEGYRSRAKPQDIYDDLKK